MTPPPVRALHEALDALLAVDLTAPAGAEVLELARELEVARRRLDAVDVRVVAELSARGTAGEYARSTTAELLISELRITPAEARARVQRADDLGPRRSLTGQTLPPLLPGAAAALTAGTVSTGHIGVLAQALDALPPGTPTQTMHVVESTLLDAAAHEHPAALRKTAALLLARVDPDGLEPRDQQIARHRDLTLTRHNDGSGRLTGRLTVEATAVWDTILDTLATPTPTTDGERDHRSPDHRSAGQRRHDGLLDAGLRLLRSGDLPPAGGVPVTVLVRTTLAELQHGRGVAITARGDLWPVADLTNALGDADIIPVLCADTGAVLHLGRTQRLATRTQRLALAARDGGCSFPGCDRPPPWTQAHHITDWAHGGTTDLDNLTLLCRYHHREFHPRGWQVQMTNGMPEWLPPPWLDPTQTPRRNHTHHPPDLTFDLERLRAA